MLAGTRDNRPQTNARQYNPATCDSTVGFPSETARYPHTRHEAQFYRYATHRNSIQK